MPRPDFTYVLRTDALRLVRDRFLLGTAGMIAALAVVFRFILPAVGARLAPAVELAEFHPLISSYVSVSMGVLIAGTIGGMLMLETREEGIIDALRSAPVSVSTVAWVQCAAIYFVAVPIIILQALIIGVGRPGVLPTLVVALASAAFAPVIAVSLATWSKDKVEAFAFMKIIGFLATVPLGVWFAPESWHWAAGILPPFPGAKAWWLAAQGRDGWMLWVAIGLAINGLTLAALLRRWR